MIVISQPSSSNLDPASRQQFLAMVPAISAHARFTFRRVKPEAREELVQEVLANCLVAFDRLTKMGKIELAFPGPLARLAVAQVRYGRRVANRLNIDDVTSEYAQRRQGFVVERLDRHNERHGGWQEIVVEDRRATPADLAAIRIDFQTWLGRLTAQQRRIAKRLATGEQGSVVARRLHLSAGRISQVRQSLEALWNDFQRQASCQTA